MNNVTSSRDIEGEGYKQYGDGSARILAPLNDSV